MIHKYLVAAAAASTILAVAPATATTIITNGGFENGSTGGNGNYNTPNGWTPNAAFTNYMFSGAIATNPHTGSYSLAISNYDSQPLATLSQTFATIVGGLYTASFYFDPLPGVNADPAAFLRVSAGNGSINILSNSVASSYAYTPSSFSFVGTGSDTLTIAAQTNHNTWLVDDVSVTGGAIPPPVSGAVPEPATWALMLIGFGMLGAAMRYRRGGTKVAYAQN